MTRRRIALLVPALALLSLAAAGLRAQAATEVRIDLERWRAAAEGSPLSFDLAGTRYRLGLEPNAVLTSDAIARLEGHGVDASAIRTFGGSLAGVPGSVARLTVTDRWAAGYVIGGARPLEIVPAEGGAVVRLERSSLPTGRMIDREPVEVPGMTANHQFGCTSANPHKVADPAGLSAGWPTKTLSMAIAVDATFVSKVGSGWAAAAVAIANGVDGIFEPSIGVNISVVDLHSHASSVLTQTESGRLLGELKRHYDDDHLDIAREDVALYTGKDLDGGTLGQANCIGGAGNRDLAYQLGQGTTSGPINLLGIEFYSNEVVKTNAHELGHIFNAHHHYANCVEATRVPLGDLCTLMINFVDVLDEKMGSFERLVMRGWAEDFI